MNRAAHAVAGKRAKRNEGIRRARSVHGVLRFVLVVLFSIFCLAYAIAVIGVAFDVRSPFSLGAAGSALLFLEGALVLLAAVPVYGWRRALAAGLLIVVLSYMIETVGINTGFPFGAYRYTDTLWPRLPGSVPLAVMCAWLLIVLGAYSLVRTTGSRLSRALLGALLGMLLDLAIEPVAAHVVHYWQWLSSGTLNYYGVPLANFGAWLVVTFLLLLLLEAIFSRDGEARGNLTTRPIGRFTLCVPCILFGANLFMFGLVDLTHGYYGGTLFAVLAGIVLSWRVFRVVTSRVH